MNGLRALMARDLRTVFLNTQDFAQVCRIVYDGHVFEEMVVILDEDAQRTRKADADDHREGLFAVGLTLYAALEDFGRVPEKGGRLWVNDRVYTIMTAACAMGRVTLELEALDE